MDSFIDFEKKLKLSSISVKEKLFFIREHSELKCLKDECLKLIASEGLEEEGHDERPVSNGAYFGSRLSNGATTVSQFGTTLSNQLGSTLSPFVKHPILQIVLNFVLDSMYKKKEALVDYEFWILLFALLKNLKLSLEKPILPLFSNLLLEIKTIESGIKSRLFSLMHLLFKNMIHNELQDFVFTADHLQALVLNLISFRDGEENSPVLGALLDTVLEYFISESTKSPNQKKVFGFIVQKLLAPFTLLVNTCPQILPLYYKTVQKLVFHQEHIPEFGFILNDMNLNRSNSKVAISQSYPKLFFEEISKDFCNQIMTHFPTFVEIYKAALGREDSFAFLLYAQLQETLNSQFEKTPSVELVQVTLELHKKIAEVSLYRPGNDDLAVSQSKQLGNQYEVLNKWADSTNITPLILAAILDVMNQIVKLDFLVIYPDINRLVSRILFSSPETRNASINLLSQLITSFAKSREVPLVLESFFLVIRENDWQSKSECNIVADSFLSTFGRCIASMLPAQAMDVASCLQSEIRGGGPVGKEQHVSKKVKVDHKNTRIACTLFIHCIIHIQVNESRKEEFDGFLCNFKTACLTPLLEEAKKLLEKDEKKALQKMVKSSLGPALDVHLVLLQVSKKYWESCVSTDEILEIFNSLHPIFKKCSSTGLTLIEISCRHLDILINKGLLVKQTQTSKYDKNIESLLDFVWKYDYEPSKKAIIVQTYIWTLCYASTSKQIKSHVTKWGNELLDTFEPSSSQILSFAPLFEIEEIRNVFLNTILELLASRVKDAEPLVYSVLEKIVQGAALGVGNMSDLENLEFTPKNLDESFLKCTQNFCQTLQALPVKYFTKVEREIIQVVVYFLEMFILESSVSITESAANVCASCRALLWRYIKARPDQTITMYHSNSFYWILKSQSKYSTNSHSTLSILGLTIRKAADKLSGPLLQKSGKLSSQEYFSDILDIMKQAVKSGNASLQLCTIFWKNINESKILNDGKNGKTSEFPKIEKMLCKFAKSMERLSLQKSGTSAILHEVVLFYQRLGNEDKVKDILRSAKLELSELTNSKQRLEILSLLLKWTTSQGITKQLFLDWIMELIDCGNGEKLYFVADSLVADFEAVMSTLMVKCSKEEYHNLVELYVKQLRNVANGNLKNDITRLNIIKGLFLMVQRPRSAGRSLLLKNWAEICHLVSKIMNRESKMICIRSYFELMIFVTKDKVLFLWETNPKAFDLSVAEISIMMGLVSSLEMNETLSNDPDVLDCFDLIYDLFYAIVRHRRDEVLHLTPQFFSAITNLLACFGSTTTETRIGDRVFKRIPNKPLELLCPMPKYKSSLVTRLIVQMSQKSMADSTKQNSIKPFAKYIPFLLSCFLTLPATTKRNFGEEEWKLACYYCLDLCDDFGREMILSNLNSGPLVGMRPIYKKLVHEWEHEHRYTGKA